jgi:hypothetical protein
MITNFSDAYINSPLVRSVLEGLPESEREAFLEQLRKNVSAYDGLVGGTHGSSHVFELLKDPGEVIPNQDGRRPPRRR